MTSPLSRADKFCQRFDLRVPILLAPMAGACPASLAIAVAKAGGMGSAGALLMSPAAIAKWMQEFRSSSNGAVQLNLWIPDPPPKRDPAHEAKVREFLGRFGPPVPESAGDGTPPRHVPLKTDGVHRKVLATNARELILQTLNF